MFRNGRMQTQSHIEKTVRHKTKKYKSHKKTDMCNQSKYSKNSKTLKNHKHSKFNSISTVSDFLGPDRLTKHVGFLSKGKISDSISRIEKIMSKEVKARAEQDLQEVLKLSHSRPHKYRKTGNDTFVSVTSQAQSLQSNYKSPQYLNHKTRFSSSTWKDKLQKSVGITTVNSVLASVRQSQKSPVKELQLIARKVLLSTVHPFIKQANNLLFSAETSSIKVMKNKLCDIKNKFLPITSVTFEEASPSPPVICEHSQTLPGSRENGDTQNFVEDNFHLNPIFTGDIIDQSDLSQMFPSANEFIDDCDNLIDDNNTINLSSDTYTTETIFSQTQFNADGKNSVPLIPISPVSSEDSPVWKLQLSPAKFVPGLDSTPTLYFRHKMF